MKLFTTGYCILLIAGAVSVDRSQGDPGITRKAINTAVDMVENAVDPLDLAAFTEEVAIVDREFAKTAGFTRADFLAKYGRSSMASGRFDLAAAAYAMFLDEFGTAHPYSARIAMRFANCLFPFKYNEVDVMHTAFGPQLHPVWRMDFTPRPERLRHAVSAYELASSIADDNYTASSALLKLGWVHRVLDDWDASTEAWDRCANTSAPTKMTADALWLAAENLAWTDQPVASVKRLRLFEAEYAGDGRVMAIPDRIEHLEAESRRPPSWLSDPVAAIQMEIKARSSARTPSEVYRSVVKWLGRKGERTAMIAVSRWACTQSDWSVDARIYCRNNLVDALLLKTTQNETGHLEAARLLGEIVDLATKDAVAVPVSIRRYRLLNKMGQFVEADRVVDEIAARVRGSRRWEPVVLTERIESLLERGGQGECESGTRCAHQVASRLRCP